MTDISDLLQDGKWLRRLAVHMAKAAVHAGAHAVQETWLVAARDGVPPELQPRPWLARVVQQILRREALGARPRERRHEAVQAERPQGTAGADEMLEPLDLQRILAELVIELDEPYRATILRRFCTGQSTAAIARCVHRPIVIARIGRS